MPKPNRPTATTAKGRGGSQIGMCSVLMGGTKVPTNHPRPMPIKIPNANRVWFRQAIPHRMRNTKKTIPKTNNIVPPPPGLRLCLILAKQQGEGQVRPRKLRDSRKQILTMRPAQNSTYPSPVYSWYVVGLLMLAYIVSYADRTILSLLIEPIKADLDLSDVQISLLLGPAFGIFYTTLGLPLGWLADRRSRRGIIAVGITLWCAMTAASGLARNFIELLLARIGVGVGEATLSPAALSLISDYFPRDKALKAIGFYFMAQSIGGGLAYLVGGQVVVSVAAASIVLLPLVGALKTWQVTFLVVGLPGLLLALLMLTVKEPRRRGQAGAAGAMPVRQVIGFLGARWRAYGALFVGNSAVTIQGYAYFWLPVLFQRRWGWDAGRFGLYFGIVLALCGIAGILAGSHLSAVLYRRGYFDAPYRTTLLGLMITIPSATLMPLMPSGEWALVLMVPAMASVAVASASGAAAVVHIAPAELRAQASAGYFLVINVLGLFLGPTSVALLTDYLFKSEQAIHLSLAMVPGVLGSSCLLILFTGLAAYRRCAREADAWYEPVTAVSDRGADAR